MGEPQRLSDTEQLQILALLEAINTEPSAMRAARALAELMRRLHVLEERVAGELSDPDRELSQSGASAMAGLGRSTGTESPPAGTPMARPTAGAAAETEGGSGTEAPLCDPSRPRY
jgi:hypothetical protein